MYIPYGRQSIDEEDINAVVQVLRSDYLTSCPTDIEIDITTDDINHEKEKSDGIYPDYYQGIRRCK